MQQHLKLPPFLFCENKTANVGAGFILHTPFPFNIGRVLKYTNDEYFNAMANTVIPFATVPGYMILIKFEGSFHYGRRLILTDEPLAQMKSLMGSMADFYYAERMVQHKGHFRKWEIGGVTGVGKK